jgi:HlyD family secretion protein
VVTYNVVIDVTNPEEKLKPGMTTNLTFTIDERNNVLKVPNAALRFTPQDANAWRNRNQTNGNGQGSRQGSRRQSIDAGGNSGQSLAQSAGQNDGQGDRRNFAPSTAPVLAGQTRLVWVLGADGKPQPRRIKIGLTDGVSTEVVEGNLQEGEMVVTGQTISSDKSQTSQTAPGFGGAPRMGGAGRR